MLGRQKLWFAIPALLLAMASAPASASTIYFQPGFTDDLMTFDTVTLAEAKVGDMGVADSWGFAFNSSGTLYGFNRSTASLYTINTSTAFLTLIGATTLASVEDLTFDLAGTNLYVTSGTNLYSLNPTNASATLIGGIGANLDGLTVSPIAQNVQGQGVLPAGTIFGTDSNSLYVVDVTTPGSTFVGGAQADETLDFDPATGILYGHNGGNFYTISLNPLASTVLGATTAQNVFAMAVQPGADPAVPEPTSLLLLGTGAAGLLWKARRRKRQQQVQ